MRFSVILLTSALMAASLSACSDSAEPPVTETVEQEINPVQNLDAADALAQQTSLVDQFRAGDLDAGPYLEQMAAFAAHPDPQVVIGSTRQLSFIYDEFPELRRDLARYVSRTYGPIYREARRSDTDHAKALSAGLGNLMAREGNDQEARNYLIRQGSLYLELDPTREDLKPTVPLHLLDSAFVETMRARPDVAFEPLINLAKTGTPSEAQAAIRGIAAIPSAERAADLLDLEKLDTYELPGSLVETLFATLWMQAEGGPIAWTFLTGNLEALTESDPQNVVLTAAPLIATKFCSLERRDEVKAYFDARNDDLPQQTANLDHAIKTIENCVELKETQGPLIEAALKAST